MYDPSIAEANTNMGNNDVNFDRMISIDEVVDVSSGEDDTDSLSDDDICNKILFLNVYLDPWYDCSCIVDGLLIFLDAHFGDIMDAWYDCSCIVDGLLLLEVDVSVSTMMKLL